MTTSCPASLISISNYADPINGISQKNANQHNKLFGQLRLIKHLLKKSQMLLSESHPKHGNYSKHYINRLNSDMLDILDSRSQTYPPSILELGISPNMSREDLMDWLDVPAYLPDLDNMKEDERLKTFCKQSAYKNRQSNWGWRVGQAAVELQLEGWHPFFITLTVDPKTNNPEKLWRDGIEFRHWLRRLNKIVTKTMGVKPAHKDKNAKASDYVKYMAVIEHGKSREHHHMHAVVWLRDIPDSWKKCPNAGIMDPKARKRARCLALETLWPHSLPGLSPAAYWRTVGDIWQMKYNFTLPLKDGKPQSIGQPRMAGLYITKYLSKDHKEWQHKVKATRNLGLKKLKNLIYQLPPNLVYQLTWRSPNSAQNHLVKMIHSIPLGLIRSIAKPRHYYHQLVSNQLDYQNVMNCNFEVYSKMLDSVRLGARPERMGSTQYYDWLGQFQPEQIGYSKEKQLKIHRKLSKSFPPDKIRSKEVKLGANEIGHT